MKNFKFMGSTFFPLNYVILGIASGLLVIICIGIYNSFVPPTQYEIFNDCAEGWQGQNAVVWGVEKSNTPYREYMEYCLNMHK